MKNLRICTLINSKYFLTEDFKKILDVRYRKIECPAYFPKEKFYSEKLTLTFFFANDTANTTTLKVITGFKEINSSWELFNLTNKSFC